MQVREWDEMADWYDAKVGDDGDLWHRTFLDPALFARLGDVSGLRVLDLACGNGHITRRFAREGARVTGVDFSPKHIARSREREERERLGIEFIQSDAARLDMLEDATFDLVICQMGLMDIPDAESAIREVGRVLREGGRFVALLSHPCFDIAGRSGWAIEHMEPERTVWRKVSGYAQPFTGMIYWRIDGELVYTKSYHRPLSWYVRALHVAGLVVTALEEPQPPGDFLAADPEGAWMRDVPLHCLIEARRIQL